MYGPGAMMESIMGLRDEFKAITDWLAALKAGSVWMDDADVPLVKFCATLRIWRCGR